MIHIDGSIGEGGGQILRSSLGLSMVTGQPFLIEKIRAGREKPGLLRQHLTAVNAAVAICGASVAGNAISSGELSFSPGEVVAGEYNFSIGSAGSTTLVLQTVLPALLLADGSSTITLEGGTHNPHAPPIDFLAKAFLPLINRMGPRVTVELERAGFYPAGGGCVVVKIEPAAKLLPLHLPGRGEIKRRLARAVVAALPGGIARRELQQVARRLNWAEDQLQIRQLPDAWGPGNLLTLEIESEHVTEVFTGFGMKGVSAEAVADQAIQQVRRYLTAGVSIGEYLADQLLLPMAIAGGGSFITLSPSEHTRTNIEVIARFLPVSIRLTDTGPDARRIEVGDGGGSTVR
jgi:RNA 3'-terminal phosphate cyclase (ATP)